ncbi:substrate-binding domain-containing protein [Anaerosacchariphilus polymeriproducens]|uniref:Sugar ABC transporter substrate-binding protein n=1 Tax=Anaerosacchariphilus polymeriproducens TaxID=1812858 RepID=A0A371AUA8_9FIRM|nr:substrate-binding domain-containing protein [Anaerosacchariphilus polymeriproducens]RDU23129.1 sugar ABC transporter substrate-binding protein [Anaerosacchariphilus polymeriproducens]
MKKLICICMSIVFAIGLLTGCSNAEKSANGNYSGVKILYSLSDSKDNFLSMIKDSAAKYAEENGIELTVADAENDILKQVTDVKEAAKSGNYDAIVICPVDADISTQIMDVAGDLPVVFLNRCPAVDKLKSDKFVFVGSDESQAAGFQAQYLTDYFNGKGKTDIKAILFQGAFGQAAASIRTSAVKKQLQENGLNVDYVFNDTAHWSRDKAKEMFQNILKMGKEYDCIICNNDEMALGVIAAMKENGIDPSSVPIVGIDATADGCAALKDGEMAFTVYQSATGQGSVGVQSAAVLAKGGSISSIEGVNKDKTIIWVPFEAVDSKNVDKYM